MVEPHKATRVISREIVRRIVSSLSGHPLILGRRLRSIPEGVPGQGGESMAGPHWRLTRLAHGRRVSGTGCYEHGIGVEELRRAQDHGVAGTVTAHQQDLAVGQKGLGMLAARLDE
jgi:hypothetical protein